MKLSTAALVILVTSVGCSLSAQNQPARYAVEGPYSLQVTMSGLKDVEDSAVLLAMYDSEASWLKPEKVYKARLVITNGTAQNITLYGIPPGTYALAAFQDNNANGKLDRWFWLLPREPFAVSKVSKLRGPPNFKSSAFNVPNTTQIDLVFN